MKKTYVKPFASFESFELSANIATGCEHITGHARNDCVYKIAGGRNVFVDELTNCRDIQEPSGDYMGVCYHVPLETNNLFTS